jgi:uroporphyrinogen-III synthase
LPRPDRPDFQALQGRRILIARNADRARPLAAVLHSKGAEALVLPLIDFERAQDQRPLDAALDKLQGGSFDWLVVSSITTVRVLLEKAAERGVPLRRLVPATTRVATVGSASRSALEALEIGVDLAPVGQQSADGLVSLWTAAGDRAFLPQADIAAGTLAEGLQAKGTDVSVVTAYHTVDYPAHPDRRLAAELPAAVVGSGQDALQASAQEVSVQDVRAALDAGALDAVVAASPSGARRIAGHLQPLGSCRLVAIGRPTAAEAARLGLTVAATAKEPTPDGITTALESIFANEGNTR